MENYNLITEQKQPSCEVQENGLDIQKLMDKGAVVIAGVRNGCLFRYEFSQN